MSLTDDLFLGTAEYHRAFQKLCQPAIDFFGLTGVAFIHIKNKKDIINIHSNVPWMEHCMKEHYYRDDPSMVNPDNISGGFAFRTAYEDKCYKNGILKDAEEKFNLCHGFTYVEKRKNSYQAFGFASSKVNVNFIPAVISNFRVVKRFIRHIQEGLNERQKEIDKYCLDFAALKGELFHTQKGIISHPPLEVQQIRALEEIGIDKSILSISLTNQERRCLRLYLEGETLQTIADEMKLSYTTVVSYFENIKNKLGCKKKSELLRIAEALELLQRL